MSVKEKVPMIEKGTIAGNLYPKYTTKNPVAKVLINGYLAALDRLEGSINPSSIHEVGCGEGNLISRYVMDDRILTGSDFSEQVIKKARQSLENNQIKFKVASIYDLTAEDSASLIICCEVLEHLEFPDKALDILAGLVKPYLIASVPQEPIWSLLNLLRGKYMDKLGNTPGHLQHWSKKGFLCFLERRFEIVKIQTPYPWTMVLCRIRK
jgi:2-polyprenyl-3-methyl-5-hydroxy-6-metoxy-1,4-benzoquinol methylase